MTTISAIWNVLKVGAGGGLKAINLTMKALMNEYAIYFDNIFVNRIYMYSVSYIHITKVVDKMTSEEKIELLEKEKAYMLSHGGDRQAIALGAAIKALEQKPILDKIFCIIHPLSIMSTPELEHKAIMQIAEMLEPLCLSESEE